MFVGITPFSTSCNDLMMSVHWVMGWIKGSGMAKHNLSKSGFTGILLQMKKTLSIYNNQSSSH